ncbi:MAG: hypothetical protein R2774_12770 [Saprospiraceae bacterium]
MLFTYQTDVDIPAGTRIVRNISIPETAMTTLWMVVNTDKYPLTLADTSHYAIDECDYTDNVFQTLMPYKAISTQEICSGDTYDFFGQSLTAAGTYTHQIPNSSGCDSVIIGVASICQHAKTSRQTVQNCIALSMEWYHLHE